MSLITFLIIYISSIVLCALHVVAYYSKFGGNYGIHPIREDIAWIILPIINTLYALLLWTICFPFKSYPYDINKHRITLRLTYQNELDYQNELLKSTLSVDIPFQITIIKAAIGENKECIIFTKI